MEWCPLLVANEAAEARAAVDWIVSRISEQAPASTDPSLVGGLSGSALLLGYHAVATRDERLAQVALEHMDRACELAMARRMPVGLIGGSAGVCWAASHLGELLCGARPDTAAAARVIDEELRRSRDTFAIDVVSGVTGIGIMAADDACQPAMRRLMATVLEILEARVERGRDGATWLTRPSMTAEQHLRRFPNGHYDLGVAHGVPGIWTLLAIALGHGLATPGTADLAAEAHRWLSHVCRHTTGPLPSQIRGDARYGTHRGSWCYGRLGVAAATWAGASAAGRPEWLAEARVRSDVALRQLVTATRSDDIGLCHGTASAAHLCGRLYRYTGNEGFAVLARRYVTRTLRRLHRGSGEGIGMFRGLAGVGLCLLTASSHVEPAWDRLLLVSAAPCP